MGWLSLFQDGFIVDPFVDPTHSYLNLKKANKIGLIMPHARLLLNIEKLSLSMRITHDDLEWTSIKSITRR
jgi:hypothetical protein